MQARAWPSSSHDFPSLSDQFADRGPHVQGDVADDRDAIEDAFPGAYNDRTRRTAAQKVASSWQQSDHLHAQTAIQKTRWRAKCTPAPMTYALLLGHLQGVRGQALFNTLWARVLDQPTSYLFDLAATASEHGILELRRGSTPGYPGRDPRAQDQNC